MPGRQAQERPAAPGAGQEAADDPAEQSRSRQDGQRKERERQRAAEQHRAAERQKAAEQKEAAERRRAAERERAAEQQKKQKAAAAKEAPASSGWTAPVSGYASGTAYGVSGPHWASGHHTGQDFAVPTGTSVRAVTDGTVVAAGWGGSYGYQVVLRHADGKYTQYAHLSSISVRTGERVTGGRQIGRSGSTGNSTGPHLHFEVRTGPGYGSDIDPRAYLRQHGVTL
ncbi:peptidoglycan DD-metalloendopeptidase family protein [Streptomyces sp. HB2AG]|nr:peptidoglycan DD-metalloendopeptidase family protein [Streptomyces sp. HB2AG]